MKISTKREKCFSQWISTFLPTCWHSKPPWTNSRTLYYFTHSSENSNLLRWSTCQKPTSNIPNARGTLRPRDILNYIFTKGSQALVTVFSCLIIKEQCTTIILYPVPSKNYFVKSKIHDLNICWRLM